MNRIYIVGEINEESFQQLSQELDRLENNKKVQRVEIILNSSGGAALDALAFYDRIRQSNLRITMTVYGACFSAAVLVLAAGDYRKMSKNAWVMVHEDSSTYKNINTSDLEKAAKISREFEDQWCRLLMEATGTTVNEWKTLHENESYLTPEECKAMNLIQEII